MEPKEFPEQNVVMGKDQPEYKPLPALRLGTVRGEVITCWDLNAADIAILRETKELWISQLTFGDKLQPILPTVDRTVLFVDSPERQMPQIIPDLVDLEKERLIWSMSTFSEATAISSLRKLESEIKEIEADIQEGNKVPEEYADALMCLLDSAGRQGIMVEDILLAFERKVQINKARTWVKNADNSYSHVKAKGEEVR